MRQHDHAPPGFHRPPPPPPPRHPYPRHERHELGVLMEAVIMWITESRDRPSVEEVIARMKEEGADAAVKKLNELDPSTDTLLAVEKVDVELALLAAVRRRALHADASDKKVGLIFPLPPRLHEAFLANPRSIILIPDDEALPPHLRSMPAERIVRGNRQCRAALSAMEIVICEVYKNSQLLASSAAADLLDERILACDARLISHARPHMKDDDVLVREAIAGRFEPY